MHRLLTATILLAFASAVPAEVVDGRSQGQLLRKPYKSTVTEQQREYFLYLPKGYETEESKLWPVILFLHGGGERGDGLAELEKVLKHGPLMEAWNKGRDLPFIMISPQMPARERTGERRRRRAGRRGRLPMARVTTGKDPSWTDEGPPQGWWVNEKDVLDMVDATLRDYRADPDRVYLTGLSYGGFGT